MRRLVLAAATAAFVFAGCGSEDQSIERGAGDENVSVAPQPTKVEKSRTVPGPGSNVQRKSTIPAGAEAHRSERRLVAGLGEFERGRSSRELYLQRADALQRRHIDDWLNTFARLKILADAGQLATGLPDMPLLFDGAKVNDDVHARLITRLNSIGSRWNDWISACAELNPPLFVHAWGFAMRLVYADPLYDEDKYDPQRAAKYLDRVRTLQSEKVEEFALASRCAVETAVLRIVFNDRLFPD